MKYGIFIADYEAIPSRMCRLQYSTTVSTKGPTELG